MNMDLILKNLYEDSISVYNDYFNLNIGTFLKFDINVHFL